MPSTAAPARTVVQPLFVTPEAIAPEETVRNPSAATEVLFAEPPDRTAFPPARTLTPCANPPETRNLPPSETVTSEAEPSA